MRRQRCPLDIRAKLHRKSALWTAPPVDCKAEWETQRAEAAEDIQRLTRVSAKSLDYAIQVFELANRAYDLMISREPRDQRALLEVLLSNSVLAEGRLAITFQSPFDELAKRPDEDKTENGDSGSPDRRHSVWSGRPDSNRRPPAPKAYSDLMISILSDSYPAQIGARQHRSAPPCQTVWQRASVASAMKKRRVAWVRVMIERSDGLGWSRNMSGGTEWSRWFAPLDGHSHRAPSRAWLRMFALRRASCGTK